MTTTTPESFWVSSGLGKRCSPALLASLEEYRSAGIEDALILQAMRETAQIAVPMPNIPEMDVMWTVTSNLLTDVNLSGKDVDSAFEEALKEAESLIANMK